MADTSPKRSAVSRSKPLAIAVAPWQSNITGPLSFRRRMAFPPRHLYHARLVNCGAASNKHDYSALKDLNALHLAVRLLEQFSSAVIGTTKIGNFLYDLACFILWRLNVDPQKVPTDIKTAAFRAKVWRHTKLRERLVQPSQKVVWSTPEKPILKVMPHVKSTRR